MMAWLPVTFQFAYIFKIVSTKKTRSVLGGLFAVLVIFSVVAGFTGQRRSSITAESLEDLSKISSTVHLHQDDLVVARHGLEWWAGWALHVKTGKEYCLKPEDWNKFFSSKKRETTFWPIQEPISLPSSPTRQIPT
jgi:hypothetical protein